MTKHYFTFTALTICGALTICFTGCSTNGYVDEKINTVTEQITAINGTLDELQTVDTTLDIYVDDLSAAVADLETNDTATAEEITAIKIAIHTLQQKDAALENKIEDLQELTATLATKNWANATFATLTQYSIIQTELTGIKSSLNDLADSVSATELAKAISASEMEMKNWVNQTLASGYYDIATIDAKLAAVEEKITAYDDTQLKEDLQEQKAALEKMKTDLTAAYQSAISSAISNHSGKMTEVIETYVQNAKNDLQFKIDSVNRYLAGIDLRLTDVEVEVRDMSQTVDSLESLVDYLLEENERLYNQINCLKDSHVIDTESEINYVWADDYSTCTATGICLHCEGQITTTATATYTDGKYIATFQHENFEVQEIDGTTPTIVN